MPRIITNGPKCPRAKATAQRRVSRPRVIGGGEGEEGIPEVLSRRCCLNGDSGWQARCGVARSLHGLCSHRASLMGSWLWGMKEPQGHFWWMWSWCEVTWGLGGDRRCPGRDCGSPGILGSPLPLLFQSTEALLALFSTARQVILGSFQCFLAAPFSGTLLSSWRGHKAHHFGVETILGGSYPAVRCWTI